MPKAAPKKKIKSAAKTAPAKKSAPALKTGSPTSHLKIATFNANSIRARLGIILDWLKKENPDVLAVQETKVQDHEFPKEAVEAAGWHVIYHGQKSYNGVAFISKKPLPMIEKRLYPKDAEEQARFIVTEIDGVQLINTYIPQGFDIESEKYKYKLKFFVEIGR